MSPSVPHRRSLQGLRVLVVEDDFLLADGLAEELAEHGLQVVGPVATVQQALRLLDDGTPIDAAILDVNIGGEMAYPVADRLAERGTPFLLASGYDAAALPARFRHVRSCEKPYVIGRILDALGA
jgi:CheY-like chemotaxis protein